VSFGDPQYGFLAQSKHGRNFIQLYPSLHCATLLLAQDPLFIRALDQYPSDTYKNAAGQLTDQQQ
jgi:hypothetical protein